MHYKNGDDIVSAFEAFVAEERTNMGDLWPQEEGTFEEQVILGYNMLQHYKLWQQQDTKKYSDRNLKFLELEYPFEVPLKVDGRTARGKRIAGRFDGLVYNTATDEYWIWETKTTRSITEFVTALSNDEQSAVYLYAAQQLFKYPVAGVLYNIIRKKAPPQPRTLVNGLLSKAAIDTTKFAYRYWIEQAYPDWSDDTVNEYFGDILLSLEENEQKYFMRYPVRKTPIEIANVMQGVYETAREMTNPATPLYPSPNWLMCNFCAFKSPCVTRTMGGDYEVLLHEEYRERTDNNEKIRGEDRGPEDVDLRAAGLRQDLVGSQLS